MQWRGRRQSSNIEDRRGAGGGFFPGGGGGRMPIGFPTGGRARAGGGLGIGAVIVIIIIAWVTGINPLEILSGGGGSPVIVTDNGAAPGTRGAPASDEEAQFVSVVLGDTEDTWKAIFAEGGKAYREPTLVLFSGQTQSACGFASAAVGPFYCPGDQKVYIDLAFYRELRDRFHAPGDFAEAYVIAHEIGHHVQNLLGVLPQVDAQRRQSDQTTANELSVRLELQADCLAGVWANKADAKGILDVGDIDEALNAAAQIGDDTIQKRSQGYVVPDSFTHGSAAQRSRWFKRGYAAGTLDACDTFGPDQV